MKFPEGSARYIRQCSLYLIKIHRTPSHLLNRTYIKLKYIPSTPLSSPRLKSLLSSIETNKQTVRFTISPLERILRNPIFFKYFYHSPQVSKSYTKNLSGKRILIHEAI